MDGGGECAVDAAPQAKAPWQCPMEVRSDMSPSDDLFDRLSDSTCASLSLRYDGSRGGPGESTPLHSTAVFLVGVPGQVSKRQLRFFLGEYGPCVRGAWLLRDEIPGQYGVVVRFCCARHAEGFRASRHGQRFTPVDTEVGIVIPISGVVTVPVDADAKGLQPPGPQRRLVGPGGHDVERPSCAPLTHLPTCPVCLSRLEPSVSGAVVRSCMHASNCMCRAQTTSAGCAVCFHVEGARRTSGDNPGPGMGRDSEEEVGGPLRAGPTVCFRCEETSGLWICVICGTIGCGRYASKHAQAHYLETGHSLALDLATQRIWDYEKDRFVHRIMAMGAEESGEGFDLELPDDQDGIGGPGGGGVDGADTKVDSVVREYSQLLAAQLEAQRTFLEEQLAQQAAEQRKELDQARSALAQALGQRAAADQERMRALRAEEKRAAVAERRLGEVEAEATFVQEVNTQLLNNTQELRRICDEEEARVTALEAVLAGAIEARDKALAAITGETLGTAES